MAKVDKQVLINSLKHYHDCSFTPGVYEHSIMGQAALLLEKSEEVVRCKDCKAFVRNEVVDTNRGDCYRYGIGCIRIMSIDDFCSKGERREGE